MSIDINNSMLGGAAVVSTGQKSLDLDLNKKNHESKNSDKKNESKAEAKVERKKKEEKEEDEDLSVLDIKKTKLEIVAEDPKNQMNIERDPMKLLKVL